MSSDREVTQADGNHTPSISPWIWAWFRLGFSPDPIPWELEETHAALSRTCWVPCTGGFSCTAAALGTGWRKWEKERSCLFLHDNSFKQLSYISVLALDVLLYIQSSHLTMRSACPETVGRFLVLTTPLTLHKTLVMKCFLWPKCCETF